MLWNSVNSLKKILSLLKYFKSWGNSLKSFKLYGYRTQSLENDWAHWKSLNPFINCENLSSRLKSSKFLSIILNPRKSLKIWKSIRILESARKKSKSDELVNFFFISFKLIEIFRIRGNLSESLVIAYKSCVWWK